MKKYSYVRTRDDRYTIFETHESYIVAETRDQVMAHRIVDALNAYNPTKNPETK